MENKPSQGTVDDKVKAGGINAIIEEELGQFGWYQLQTVSIVILFLILAGLHNETLFSAARIKTRCLIPECENDVGPKYFHQSWIPNAIPKTSCGSLDNCRRFARNISYIASFNQSCPAAAFDQEITTECEEYVYENQNTVVYDFELACNEWGRTLIGTISSSAKFISLPLIGFISDRWGRRTAFTLSVFCTSLFGLARYWCRSYAVFIMLGFAHTVFHGGAYPSAMILSTEVVGPKYRVLVGLLVNIGSSSSEILLGLTAWAVPYWRQLTLVSYIPTLTIILFWFAYQDSVRWYISKGLFKKAEKVLKRAARLNKKQLSENVFTTLKRITEEQMKNEALKREKGSKEPWLIVEVFRHKPILIRCLVIPVWWITFTFIYYGLVINSVYLELGNPYITFVAVAAIDLPGNIIGLFLLNNFGRKTVLSGACFICAASQISYLVVPKEQYAVCLALYLIGKSTSSIMTVTIYLYTSELYPTKYRQRFLAFSSMIGRIGSTVSTITPALGDQLPYIIYACLATLSGMLAFVTPETFGTKYPDTLEEASEMGHKKKNKKVIDIK